MKLSASILLSIVLLGQLLLAETEPIQIATQGAPPESPLFEITPEKERIRYRLNGLESDWIEPEDAMNMVVYFIGQDRVAISRVTIGVSGSSSGWTGELNSAPFQPRREVISVPPGTVKVRFIFTSSGSPRCVGCYLIRNFSATARQGGLNQVLLKNGLDSNQESSGWFKSGNNPSLAIEGPGFPAEFQIIDDDLSAHVDWGHPTLPIESGELILEWQEAYSMSQGGNHSIKYDRLPPGKYVFEVEELSITGTPTGNTTSVTFKVPRPLWRTWWFWLLCFLLLIGITSLVIFSSVSRKIQRAVRHARLIENERLRIAMDLHDDIGTRLSQISLIGSHARMNTEDSASKNSFQKITGLTSELASSLSETVWMLSPKNNDLESLIGFLCRTASELCRTAMIRCRIDADPIDQEIPISQEFRHHLVLSVKEVLNNAIKHSNADEILLQIRIGTRDLAISVSDNGDGMPAGQQKSGNGLTSLQRRMSELNGRLEISPSPSDGVQILLEAPLKQQKY